MTPDQLVTPDRLAAAAGRLARSLDHHKVKLVLAESCTGGMVAAALTGVPGISAWFCGSAVTYQEATKIAWLGLQSAALRRDSAVAATTTRSMAEGVLRKTPQAEIAIAVTGHFGPDAPHELDGQIFVIALARNGELSQPRLHQATLQTLSRTDRQLEASVLVLDLASRWIETNPPLKTA